MLRLAALVLIAVLGAPAGFAQSAALDANPDYQAGLSAMRDRLPELAIPRFEKARAAVPDDPAAQRLLGIRMGEAAVRAARMAKQRADALRFAETALAELTADHLKGDETALFWAGQAALVVGRPGAAVEYFAQLAEARDSALRHRAQLARAHLLASLGRSTEAERLLATLASAPDAGRAGEARLLHGSLLLDAGRIEEAAALLDNGVPEAATEEQRLHRSFLLARLAQLRGDHSRAAALFRPLAENRRQLSATIQHGAIVGLADSLAADPPSDESIEEAIDLLIRLVDQHPDSPLLEAALSRLLALAKTDETLRSHLVDRLRLWAAAPGAPEAADSPPGDSPDPESPPALPEHAKRAGYALYYYALHLAEKNDPDSNELAASLLAGLRSQHPGHPLAPLSRLETARLHSAAGRNAEAIATLEAIEPSAVPPAVMAETAKLTALLQFKEADFAAAAESFARARELLEPGQRDLAALNAGVSLLRGGDSAAFVELLASLESPEVREALELERALYLASQRSGDARAILDRFLRENPAHPRAPEAQLAYAAELLRLDPAQEAAQREARARLEVVDPADLDDAAALRHLLTRHELAHLTDAQGDWQAAIAAARNFLESRQAGTLAPAVRLKLAEAYYMNDQHGNAQNEFLKVAEVQPAGLMHEVALFFAAKAALKLSTEKSPAEAVELLRRVVALDGVTASEARLELARSLTARDPHEALATLAPLLGDDAVAREQIEALVLAAEAHRALGTDANLREALAIYDEVLANDALSYALSNRFHLLKGQAREQLGEAEEARKIYYRVVNFENLPEGENPSEWGSYNRCASRLVSLLEEEERWKSALGVLHNLATSDNPRAAYWNDRFEKMQLERQIWDLE